MTEKLPKHIVRLLLLLGFVAVMSFAAKIYFTDPSYYRYGYYRADAVPQIAAGIPLYRGAEYCLECHQQPPGAWVRGAHKTVQCEVCHGTDRGHPDTPGSLLPTDSIRLCSTCHEAMPARPSSHPQIVLGEHPSTHEATEPCQSCHDPHSPGDFSAVDDTGVTASAVPAFILSESVSKCARCHGKQGEGRRKNPAIAGIDPETFFERMKGFRSGEGKSKAMIKAAQPLSDEAIAELAAYYENLKGDTPASVDRMEPLPEGEFN